MIKKMILLVITLLLPMTAMAEKPNNSKKADKEYQELLKKSPFNKMYPQDLAPAAATYFTEWNQNLFKDGPILRQPSYYMVHSFTRKVIRG